MRGPGTAMRNIICRIWTVQMLPFNMFKMKELTSTSSIWVIIFPIPDHKKPAPEQNVGEGSWEQQAIARITGKATLAMTDAYLYHYTRWAVVLHHYTTQFVKMGNNPPIRYHFQHSPKRTKQMKPAPFQKLNKFQNSVHYRDRRWAIPQWASCN